MSQKINVTLSDDATKKLEMICKNNGLKKSAVITLLINGYNGENLLKGGKEK